MVDAGIRVSCFIEPDPAQVAASKEVGAQVVELHTGAYCQAVRERKSDAAAILERLQAAAPRPPAWGWKSTPATGSTTRR
jgi:pyridoxine 5-phosphate synthase